MPISHKGRVDFKKQVLISADNVTHICTDSKFSAALREKYEGLVPQLGGVGGTSPMDYVALILNQAGERGTDEELKASFIKYNGELIQRHVVQAQFSGRKASSVEATELQNAWEKAATLYHSMIALGSTAPDKIEEADWFSRISETLPGHVVATFGASEDVLRQLRLNRRAKLLAENKAKRDAQNKATNQAKKPRLKAAATLESPETTKPGVNQKSSAPSRRRSFGSEGGSSPLLMGSPSTANGKELAEVKEGLTNVKAENASLEAKNVSLKAENANLKAEIGHLKAKNTNLVQYMNQRELQWSTQTSRQEGGIPYMEAMVEQSNPGWPKLQKVVMSPFKLNTKCNEHMQGNIRSFDVDA